MLNFVNTFNELSFQTKFGIPDDSYGLEIAMKNKPLDFQYDSTESVTSFLAIKVDSNENPIDSINLSTSLITSNGVNHICTGLIDYASDLDGGLYYFLVNSKYQSEYFSVVTDLVQGSLGLTPISISGLEFFDNTIQKSWRSKEGAPVDTYGMQYTENWKPLPFIYLATDAISSFKAVNLSNGIETSLSTSLITSNGTYHNCSGLVNYATDLGCGIYYFVVNGRYESELFATVELNNYYLLKEDGFYILKEDGGKLILG